MTAIPILGLGTFGRTGPSGIGAMLKAIEIGYRHLDTAQTYDTESTVGEAARRSGIARDKFFITTKIADYNLGKHLLMTSVERSLETIGLGPVDLLLIHWPSHKDEVPLEDYIEGLVLAQQRKLTRLIGVSNFNIPLLERTIAMIGKDAIATNQVEIHPYIQAPKLCGFARKAGVKLTAYQPLAKGRVNSDSVLKAISARHGVAVPAVALAFLIAEGHIVIPASSSEQHLRDNFRAMSVELTDGEIRDIRGLDRGSRFINPEKSPAWDD